MNRKADIMVSFIVTLILSLIIFVPACMLTSEFFRLSDQAKDKFNTFVKEITSMSKEGKEGENRIDVLILDDKTAMVYFRSNVEELKIAVDAAAPTTDYSIIIKNPKKCNEKNNCLCLFRKANFDTTWWKPGYDTVTVTEDTGTPAICVEIESDLILENCGIGTPHSVHSYTCSEGFMVERNLAKGSSWAVKAYYEANRRTSFTLTKEGSNIRLKPQT